MRAAVPWTCDVHGGFLPDFGWSAFFVEDQAVANDVKHQCNSKPDKAFFQKWSKSEGMYFSTDTFEELAADLYEFLHEKFATAIAERDFDKAASWVIVASKKAFTHTFFRLRYSSPTNPGYPFLEEKHDPSKRSALPDVRVAVIRDNTLHAGLVREVSDVGCTIPLAEPHDEGCELPRVTRRPLDAKNPRQFKRQALDALLGVNLRKYPARTCTTPQPPAFPSPPRGSIVTTNHCLRTIANIYACNFNFQTRHLHFRLSHSSDDVLHMRPVKPNVVPMKDRHQDRDGLGERFEAAVTSKGDEIYSCNMLELGDGITVCYTAQQDAIIGEEERLVEVKTLQQSRDQSLQCPFLPLPMLMTCFLRDIDTLCLGFCERDVLHKTSLFTRKDLRARDARNQLPQVIGFLCKTLMRLRQESRNWASGDEYDLLYTYPDQGFVLHKRNKEKEEEEEDELNNF